MGVRDWSGNQFAVIVGACVVLPLVAASGAAWLVIPFAFGAALTWMRFGGSSLPLVLMAWLLALAVSIAIAIAVHPWAGAAAFVAVLAVVGVRKFAAREP